ncbi:MAG: DUF2244 domain-containing protein [Kiloniellales bacterium]|nr:DUF2244 domain-containing protein [Kiloniellales bacterium]
MVAKDMSARDDEVLFDVVLTPHRSLSPLGFLLLMGALVAVSFLAGLLFLLAGAWPVAGFLGLDVLLVYIAFRINYRRARMYETLHLTRQALTVRRVDPSGGERRWQFTPAWLQVLLDEPPARTSPLTLRSHGKSLAIGGFLTAEERRSLAAALTAALAEARSVPQGG